MELYHVMSRGVEKRKIVMDDRDRARFVHDLFVMNDSQLVRHISQPGRNTSDFSGSRRLLVHIHAFCLMDNHYHLLLSDVVESGIPKFIQKLNMGYTKYFNERHNRSGALWQGKHKKVHITEEKHFLYIPYYIHLNALDSTASEWREGRVRNSVRALKDLRNYRWSSHLDYLGKKNFPSITYRNFIAESLGSASEYEREIVRLIKDGSHTSESAAFEY